MEKKNAPPGPWVSGQRLGAGHIFNVCGQAERICSLLMGELDIWELDIAYGRREGNIFLSKSRAIIYEKFDKTSA